MAVLPISSVNTKNHTVSFQGRKKTSVLNADEGKNNQPNTAGKMVTVPVAVLMALATSSLNAKAPANQNFDKNIDQTELLAYTAQTDDYTPTKSVKTDDYYIYFNNLYKAGRVAKALEIPGKEPYTMILLRDEPLGEGEADCCDRIIMLPHKQVNRDNKGNFQEAPEITKFIYHDIGEENEFCGALVQRTKRNGTNWSTETFEIKLPTIAANLIMSILANDSDYVNFTDIKFEKTKSAALQH